MKLLIELSPSGGLSVYLHGAHSPTQLRPGSAEVTLIRMLRDANLLEERAKRITIGEVAAPSEAQLYHWENHQKTRVKGCAFCRVTPDVKFESLEEFFPKVRKKR